MGTDKIYLFKKVSLPGKYNYIACFLTLRCNYNCSFCLNRFNGLKIEGKELSGRQWVEGLNRLNLRDGLAVTLEGGEPSLHRDFIYIINNLRPGVNIDILTNLNFDLDEFISSVNPERLKRKVPYASIRASFYPEAISIKEITGKVSKLMKAGFKVGLYGVEHPEWKRYNEEAKQTCKKLGIDFRTKEFLGFYRGRLYGTWRYRDACLLEEKKEKLCRINELIIGPGGDIYRCHSDLYSARKPIGHLLDDNLAISYEFRRCDWYGFCHPCDIKIKTNRYQEYGHTSVEIKNL